MSDVLIDTQSVPSAPSSGQLIVYPDSNSVALTGRNSTRAHTVGGVRNAGTGAQAFTTSEIYLTGSGLLVPTHLMQLKATFKWHVVATKTAGTGALLWRVRVGTAGTTADTERILFTQVSTPTSATDTGWWDIEATVVTAGASGILRGGLRMSHVLDVTGWSQLRSNVQFVASGTFDMTLANLIVGLTFNHQTAGAGNIEMVSAELVEAAA